MSDTPKRKFPSFVSTHCQHCVSPHITAFILPYTTILQHMSKKLEHLPREVSFGQVSNIVVLQLGLCISRMDVIKLQSSISATHNQN